MSIGFRRERGRVLRLPRCKLEFYFNKGDGEGATSTSMVDRLSEAMRALKYKHFYLP